MARLPRDMLAPCRRGGMDDPKLAEALAVDPKDVGLRTTSAGSQAHRSMKLSWKDLTDPEREQVLLEFGSK